MLVNKMLNLPADDEHLLFQAILVDLLSLNFSPQTVACAEQTTQRLSPGLLLAPAAPANCAEFLLLKSRPGANPSMLHIWGEIGFQPLNK